MSDPKVVYSPRLEVLLQTRREAAFDDGCGTCTNGYDNDGSTGYEIFENGVDLGISMGLSGLNAYCGSIPSDGVGATIFVCAASEDEAVKIVEGWAEDDSDEE